MSEKNSVISFQMFIIQMKMQNFCLPVAIRNSRFRMISYFQSHMTILRIIRS